MVYEENNMCKRWIIVASVLMLLLLCGCASGEDAAEATMQPIATPTATPEPVELDGSVFDSFIQASRDYNYYAIIPGEGNEPLLILTNIASFCEADLPDYPEDGFYTYTASLFRYMNGSVEEVESFYTMDSALRIDTENRIIYRFWGGQGVHEDIAEHYAVFDGSHASDTLDLEIETGRCSRNGESITKEEYDSLLAERTANRVALQVFPIERDLQSLVPTLQQDSYVLVQPGDAEMLDGTIYLTFTDHYYEVFPVDQIRKLEKGDNIVIEGESVTIDQIEYNITEMEGEYAGKTHYYVMINQKYQLCSASLDTPELLYHVGDNDGKFYQDGKIRTLPIQQDVKFFDYLLSRDYDENGIIPIEVDYQDIPNYFSQQEIGVEIEINNGVITSICREWHP